MDVSIHVYLSISIQTGRWTHGNLGSRKYDTSQPANQPTRQIDRQTTSQPASQPASHTQAHTHIEREDRAREREGRKREIARAIDKARSMCATVPALRTTRANRDCT